MPHFSLHFGFFWIVLLLVACQNESSPAAITTTAPQGLHLIFSAALLLDDRDDPNNWCFRPWPEPISISADAINTNRRYFALGTGAHRVAVDHGKLTAAFGIRIKSNEEVQVFTSDNFTCFSNRKNFRMAADAQSFHYDNEMGVHFDAGVESRPNGLVAWVEMPPGAGFGILAHRCEGCK